MRMTVSGNGGTVTMILCIKMAARSLTATSANRLIGEIRVVRNKVSSSEQSAPAATCHSLRMNGEIHMLAVELDGSDGLVVTFSDGTTGGYVIEELLGLRPVRERLKINRLPKVPKLKAQS
jgi:hypothetical protein